MSLNLGFLTENTILIKDGVILKSYILNNGFIKVSMQGVWPSAKSQTSIYPSPGEYISWPLSRIFEHINEDINKIKQDSPSDYIMNPLIV